MKKIIYALLIGLMMKGVMFAAIQKEIEIHWRPSDKSLVRRCFQPFRCHAKRGLVQPTAQSLRSISNVF